LLRVLNRPVLLLLISCLLRLLSNWLLLATLHDRLLWLLLVRVLLDLLTLLLLLALTCHLPCCVRWACGCSSAAGRLCLLYWLQNILGGQRLLRN